MEEEINENSQPSCFETLQIKFEGKFSYLNIADKSFSDVYISFILFALLLIILFSISWYCDLNAYTLSSYETNRPESARSLRIFNIDAYANNEINEKSSVKIQLIVTEQTSFITSKLYFSCNSTFFYRSNYVLFLDSPKPFPITNTTSFSIFDSVPIKSDTFSVSCRLSGDLTLCNTASFAVTFGSERFDYYTTFCFIFFTVAMFLIQLFYFVVIFAFGIQPHFLQYCVIFLVISGGSRLSLTEKMAGYIPSNGFKTFINISHSVSISIIRMVWFFILSYYSPVIIKNPIFRLIFFLLISICYIATNLSYQESKTDGSKLAKSFMDIIIFWLTAFKWINFLIMPKQKTSKFFKSLFLSVVVLSWLSFWVSETMDSSGNYSDRSAVKYFCSDIVDEIMVFVFAFYGLKSDNENDVVSK